MVFKAYKKNNAGLTLRKAKLARHIYRGQLSFSQWKARQFPGAPDGQ